MAGMFDDLIPQQPAAGGNAPASTAGGMFDDLIPQQVSGVTQGVTAPLRIQMGNPPPQASDGTQPQPSASFMDRLSNLWEHPPSGPSLIGAARSLYDAVLTPGNVIKAAEENAKKTQITDSDLPISSGTLAAPAMNMAQNIFLPAPGPGVSLALGKQAEAPAYGANTAQKKASEIVTSPLKSAGLNSPQDVESALAKIGPEAVLADADPRLTQLAGTIAAKPGPAQQILRAPLEARNTGAKARITGTMNDVLGQPVDLSKAGNEIYTAAKTAATPLYEQAYQTPIQSTPELQQALSTPAGQIALKKAKMLAANNPGGPQSAMFNAPPAVDLSKTFSPETLANMPDRMRASLEAAGVTNQAPQVDVRGLHLIRQAFDDMISRAKNPITSAGKNSLAGLQQNRAAVDSVLKQVPPMAQADKIFADQSAIRDAMAQGLNIFKNSNQPEDVAALVNGMSDAEKAAYQQGVRVAARNVMGTARNAPSAARSTLTKEFNQEKLATALGKDAADQILGGRISPETKYAETDHLVLRNSVSANRLLGKEALDQAHSFPDAMSTVNYSHVTALPRHIILKSINKVLSAAKEGQQQAVETEVAKLLTLGRNDRAPILQALYQEGLRRDPSGNLNRMIVPFVLQRATAPSLLQSQ